MAWQDTLAGVMAGIAGDPSFGFRMQQQRLKMQMEMQKLQQDMEEAQQRKEQLKQQQEANDLLIQQRKFDLKWGLTPVSREVEAPETQELMGGEATETTLTPGGTPATKKQWLTKPAGEWEAIGKVQKLFQTAQPPAMTPYQSESLKLKKEEGEENRKLRQQTTEENRQLKEQMHKDNVSLRREMLDLRKFTSTRVPPSVQKDINNKTSQLDQYIQLIDSFKDGYAGAVIGGPTMTEIYSRTGGKKDRVNWWKQWKLLDSKVRHELFGATLTGFEKANWDAVTVSENTDPKIVREAMQTRLGIAKNALNREVEGYSEAGWGVNAPVEKPQSTPSTDKYEVGKIYTDKQGRKAKYMGNGKWQLQK